MKSAIHIVVIGMFLLTVNDRAHSDQPEVSDLVKSYNGATGEEKRLLVILSFKCSVSAVSKIIAAL